MASLLNCFVSLLLLFDLTTVTFCAEDRELLVVTVATNETDGYRRFIRSTKVYGLEVMVLGMGVTWEGGDMNLAGGGHKINLLTKALEKYKDDDKKLILFTDSYDVIFTNGKDAILEKFDRLEARVVFGAEDFCWPNNNLATQYPRVSFGYKYLNSGGFIGYAPEVYKVISAAEVDNSDDDQLYYTKVFLDKTSRDGLKIKLDTQARIFQNLNGQFSDVSLKFDEDDTHLINTVYQTTPVVIHGNGPSKILLNSVGNYIAKSWIPEEGCLACKEQTFDLDRLPEEEYPRILVAVFVLKPLPFLEEMLDKVAKLNYPKKRIDLLVYNQVALHEKLVNSWAEKLQKKKQYGTVKLLPFGGKMKEWHARNLATEQCLARDCDALLNVDGEVHLDNSDTLKLLISHNRPVLGAMVIRQGQAWSTFWGAINAEGYYARSMDYMDIVNNNRRGIWNVPYISGIYLIQKSVLDNPETRPSYINKLFDADMAMAANMREKGVFMYVTNLEEYGHLVDPDYFTTKYMFNDMWQMKANKYDWEQRYISPMYWSALDTKNLNEMPCPDVYWFPIFTPRFCEELVELANDNGGWSDGTNDDPRLAGGYENVPTIDIHMNQMEFEQEWLWILRHYVKPLAEKVYLGYDSAARAIMNFIVRYKPTEQPLLRPHHDSSTYTINVGLNRPHIDYEGGGAHFIRYNCSVVNTRVGWALMHPGRLTHYHEGLPTTKGTRYIMVSFIDP